MDITPSKLDEARSASITVSSLTHSSSTGKQKRRHMKRTRSAPDCKRFKIGVCAMDKKAQSKPMREILARLTAFGEFEIVNFGDEVILNRPVAEWPLCDVMLSWHSDGFPLARAKEYVALRRPTLINDILKQELLLDRRKVYQTLMANGIPVPRHIIVSRDMGAGGEAGPEPDGFVEGDDWVELNGVRIEKPFVEKPVSGEDHNIWIFYPSHMGGGVKRLFRKVNNRSADYDPKHPGTVRRDGSYIYEEFLTTGGTDVKVYTVGPGYAHAEARKSPVVDGKVNRTPDGKEVRFPVLLSPQEKEIARMVCRAFGQQVCGFDLLRSEKAKSYVCDVNGWSFVKNSRKYYDDAAGLLRSMILNDLAPARLKQQPLPPRARPLRLEGCLEESGTAGEGGQAAGGEGADEKTLHKDLGSLQDLPAFEAASMSSIEDDDSSGASDGEGAGEGPSPLELRCVLAVVRHGDRTPKQKMKMTVSQAPLIELFNKHKDGKGKQAKLKSPSQLQELLDITRQLLADMDARDAAAAAAAAAGGQAVERDEAQEELREKLRIVRTVLEQGGQFSGINRKVQLKPVTWVSPPSGPSTPASAAANPAAGEDAFSAASVAASAAAAAAAAGTPGEASSAASTPGGGAGSKEGKKGAKGAKDGKLPVVKELMLILKYGGVLTHAGRKQAEDLGKTFRMVMYPRYGPAGGGLLRLHSTYRHDLKIYSSDEGRVQMSAAAFTQGLLDLEGNSLTPILVSLVNKNASMLDAFGKGASEDILAAKNTLYQYLTWDADKATSLCSKLAQPLATPVVTSPPMSPRHEGQQLSAFGRQAAESSNSLAGAGSSGVLGGSAPRSAANSLRNTKSREASPVRLASLPAAAVAARVSSGNLPISNSCVDLLARAAAAGSSGAAAAGGSTANNSSSSSSSSNHVNGGPFSGGRAPVHLPPTAAASAAAASAAAASSVPSSSLPPVGSAGRLSKEGSGAPTEGAQQQQQQQQRLQVQISLSTPSPSLGLAELQAHQQAARASAVSHIRGMPDKPLVVLQRMVELMKVLVDELRQKCLEERLDGPGASHYSSLSMAPEEWTLEAGRPCSGERLLLMFDRWRKLLKSFYNDKKQQFDISKVPDIYDSAKYDSIHNSHLNLSCLKELYSASRRLAAVVVPHEYGLDPPSKLRIGAKICCELLAKLLADLDATKEESIATATIEARQAAQRAKEEAERGLTTTRSGPSASHLYGKPSPYDLYETGVEGLSLQEEGQGRLLRPAPLGPAASGSKDGTAAEGGEAEGEEEDGSAGPAPETIHRLCPTYASDINSPLRHVRTRIYFTSESHIHSLINVLRFCHLKQRSTAPSSVPSSAPMSQSSSLCNIAGLAEGQSGAAGSSTAAAAAAGGGGSAGAASTPPGAAADSPSAGAAGGSELKSRALQHSSSRRSTHSGSQPDLFATGGSSSSSTYSASQGGLVPLVSPQGQALLTEIDECDYLTHIVFRMYEDKRVPLDAPERFVIEILFSNGAATDPTLTALPDHTLPTTPRSNLVDGHGVSLARLVELVGGYASDTAGVKLPATGSTGSEAQGPGRTSLCHTPSLLPVSHMPSRLPSGSLPPLPPTPAAAAAVAPAVVSGFSAASAGSVSVAVPVAVVAAAAAAVGTEYTGAPGSN